MLTENDVVDAVAKYLEQGRYTIEQKLNTSQQGIDIVASHPAKGICYVEAKGGTSSKPTSKRAGLPFNYNQVKTHVGVALIKSFQTMQDYPDATVAIALPNNSGHKKMIDSIELPIKNSGIKVFMINDDGTVEERI